MNKRILRKVQMLEIEILDEIVRICDENNINYYLIAGTLIGAVRHKGFIPWDDDLDIAMMRDDYEKFLNVCESSLNNRFIIDSHETSKIYYRLAAKVRIKNSIYMQRDLKKYKGEQGIWIDILPLDNINKPNTFKEFFQATVKSILEVAIENKRKIDISEKSKYKVIIAKLFSIFPINLLIEIQKDIMMFDNNENNNYIVNFASKYNYKRQTFKKELWEKTIDAEFEGKYYKIPIGYDEILKSIYGDYMEIPPKSKQEIHNPILIRFENGDEYCEKEI